MVTTRSEVLKTKGSEQRTNSKLMELHSDGGQRK
jgi:hypothetical protein